MKKCGSSAEDERGEEVFGQPRIAARERVSNDAWAGSSVISGVDVRR